MYDNGSATFGSRSAHRGADEVQPLPESPFRLEPYTHFILEGVDPSNALGLTYWAIRATGSDAELRPKGCRWLACRYSLQGYVELLVTTYTACEDNRLVINVQCLEGDRLAFREVYQSMLGSLRDNGLIVRTASQEEDNPNQSSRGCMPTGCMPPSFIALSKAGAKAVGSPSGSQHLMPMPNGGISVPSHWVSGTISFITRASCSEKEVFAGRMHSKWEAPAMYEKRQALESKEAASDGGLRPLLDMVTGRYADEQKEGARSLSCLSALDGGRETMTSESVVNALSRLVQQVASHILPQVCAFAAIALANLSERRESHLLIARTGIVPHMLRLTTCTGPNMDRGIIDLEMRRECARTLANIGSSHAALIMSSCTGREGDTIARWIAQASCIADDRLRTHVMRLQQILRL